MKNQMLKSALAGAVMMAVSGMGQTFAADAPQTKEPAKAEAPKAPAKKAAAKKIDPALKEELDQQRAKQDADMAAEKLRDQETMAKVMKEARERAQKSAQAPVKANDEKKAKVSAPK
jgi:hypothetical protein